MNGAGQPSGSPGSSHGSLHGSSPVSGDGGAGAIQRLRETLTSLSDADRFAALSTVFAELSEQSRGGASAGQLESMTRRLKQLQQENASLSDELATTRADLAHHATQWESEQSRSREIQKVIDEQRSRLATLQEQNDNLEIQLVTRNNELHNIQTENERLLLQSQRAELAADDRSKVYGLEESKMELASQIESIKRELEKLREDKNREIDTLKAALEDAKRQTMTGADALLATLWQRLAACKPPLVEGHVTPDIPSAERTFDAVYYLAKLAHDIDEDTRVFLSKYTQHESPLREPWETYAARPLVREAIKATLAPGGTALAPLRLRLNLLHSWVSAATIANDSAMESIASELHAQLMGPEVAGSDMNIKVKDYVRGDGHYKFMESMRRYRDRKMAEVYARGSQRGAEE